MGEVYRARDTRLDRDVAIKILPETFAHEPERVSRFQREAKTLAALNHPNIGGIHGLEEGNGVTALVLELVEGPTLAERIGQEPIPLDEVLLIARQIAEALAAAHELGIIHRDLKPANVKVRPDGAVKVLDFGLAKAMDPVGSASQMSQSPTITTPAMTQAGMILGTAAYMAPEQAKGRPADKRSDVWAFGCVLYEMLAGRRVFQGEDVSDTLAAVLRAEPDWTALPRDVPGSIRALLEGCLTKDRRQRIADISATLFVINHQARLAAGIEAPLVPPHAPRKPLWRRALLYAAAVAVTAAGAGYAAWTLKPPPVRSVTRFSITLPGGELFTNSNRHLVALSPDGTRLAYAANNRLYLRALDQLDASPIRGTEAISTLSSRSPFFSFDGQWIGFWAGGQLRKVPVNGGAPVTLCAAENPLGASWGSDDTIAFGQGGAGIWRVSANGGNPEHVVKLDAGQRALGPQILPDGRTMLFTLGTGTAPPQIVAQSLDTGARTMVINGGTDARYLTTGHIVYALRGTLLAVPFDPESHQVRGGPVPLVEDVLIAAGTGVAHFSVAANGALAYVPGFAEAIRRTLVWVDRQGREEPIAARPRPYLYPRLSPDGTQIALDIAEENRDIWVWDLARRTLMHLTIDPTPDRAPVWTSDGRRLIFSSERAGTSNCTGSSPTEQGTPSS